MERRLVRVDRRGLAAAVVGHRPVYPVALPRTVSRRKVSSGA
jgi:hypothetical protein